MIYKTCSELPLFNFIKIIVTSDVSWMEHDHDNPKEIEGVQASAWHDIQSEYGLLTKNVKQVAVIELLKEITIINNKLELVNSIVLFMANDFDKDLVDILRSMGFMYAYDPYSESYDKDLQLTISAAKRLIFEKQSAEIELKKLNENNKEATEQDYLSLIVALSKFQGYRIDWKLTSVAEYTEILNSYQKQADGK